MPPERRLRWGVLGTGVIARLFVADLLANGLAVTAVGSRSSASAAAFAAAFALPHSYGSYESLVASDTFDVAYVATPHPLHSPHALLALDGGKHVLVEKPFTIDAQQAGGIADRARRAGLVAMEAMWTRFLPHMRQIDQRLRDGALGRVQAVIADHTQRLPDDPGHRINALELGGGALLDLGVYPVSFASQVLGTPATVSAGATFRSTGADAQTGVVLGYRSGATASLFCGSTARGPNAASVIGERGRIDIDPVWYVASGFRRYDADGTLLEIFSEPVNGRGMHFEALEVERLVEAGALQSETMSLDESVRIMETLDRIREQIGLRYPGE